MRNCENLIIAATYAAMRHKRQINLDRRLSKKTTFLANRAAARAQQSAPLRLLLEEAWMPAIGACRGGADRDGLNAPREA
jgi:hypothetical protein